MSEDVEVVIVTWQGRELLGSCLDHLRRQTLPHQVIVVDNASTDGTADFVRTEYPEVRVLELSENLGFGAGNNRGVAAGTAPFVVLINNDVDVEPEFLEFAVQPLWEDDLVGAVAALTTRPGTGLVDQFGIELDAGLCAYARGTGQDPVRLAVGPLAAPCGAAVAYRRNAYEQSSGFDEQLFAYTRTSISACVYSTPAGDSPRRPTRVACTSAVPLQRSAVRGSASSARSAGASSSAAIGRRALAAVSTRWSWTSRS